MRVLPLRKHDAPVKTELPEAVTVYEAALERLVSSHEKEAAAYLSCCRLEIVPGVGAFPLREELQPVRLVLTKPADDVSKLAQNLETRARVRQALDRALGPTVYLAQMVILASTSAQAA
jgi:hypothetical protein